MGNANNIQINPVNVYWRIEAQESWDFTGATASGLGGKYVTMYLPDGTGYYAWFDENNTDTDPAPGGLTAIPVDYAAAATASAIATAFQTAVEAVTGFTATISGLVVKTKRDAVGQCTLSTIGTVTAGLALTILRKGKDLDLGLLQGDIEPNFSPSNLSITAHQFGLTPLASLSQGFETLEVETVLLETDTAKLKELYKIYGGTLTPGGGTELFGAGTSVLGKNMLVEAARLIFKPVNSGVDDTKNFNFTLAVPVPSSIVFSGENPQTLNVSWSCFTDLEFNSNINAIAIGDIFQTGL
jgi:hypothetical protein